MGSLRMALLGLAAMSAGCAASPASPANPAPKQEAAADAQASATQVQIDNQNYSDMDVYLLNGGTRVLLGSAPALTKTTLSLPRGSTQGRLQVRLLADPIGGARSIRSPALVVAPGENIYWTIGADAASSSASAG